MTHRYFFAIWLRLLNFFILFGLIEYLYSNQGFSADTLVKVMDKNADLCKNISWDYAPLSEVGIGDYVCSRDFMTEKLIPNKVVSIFCFRVKNVCLITFQDVTTYTFFVGLNQLFLWEVDAHKFWWRRIQDVVKTSSGSRLLNKFDDILFKSVSAEEEVLLYNFALEGPLQNYMITQKDFTAAAMNIFDSLVD